MASKRSGRGTVLFGLFVLLAGLIGAVVLFLLARQQGDDAIRDLARAPVGCDTTLSFSDTGTFYVYVEHLGTLESLDGDCETPDDYSRDAANEPTVEITVTDPDGNELELNRVDTEFTYSDGDAFAGTAKRRVEIESTGDYVVTVDSDEDDFVVAVGRDPGETADTMRLGAIASGIAGIVLGLGLVLIGVRRRRRARRLATAYTAGPQWQAGAPLPTAPPAMHEPLTQPFPAPHQAGPWSPAQPVGPPAAGLGPPYGAPVGPPTTAPFAPPRVFAPPEVPSVPASPPGHAPSLPRLPDADRGDGGDVRGDASR